MEPWLQFEAGALGNVLDAIRVCPYCFEMDTAVQFPLATFQAVAADESGTRHLVSAMNKSLGSLALGERQLDDTFDLWWPMLNQALSDTPPVEHVPPPKTEKQMLQELVNMVRHLVADRSPDERAAELIELFKGLFQGVGAPPLPPYFENAIRKSLAEITKNSTERTRRILGIDPQF
jgi:hypothetical protein